MSAEETAAIFAENSSGWGRKKTWGKPGTPAPAEEAPAAPVQEEAPAPVAEPEVKAPAQPAADPSDDEMSAEETAAIFAENSSGWGRKKTWGKPSAPAPAEEAPAAPVQEEAPAPVAEPEVKAPEQPAEEATDDEMSAEETAAIFAENSSGWKRKKAWGKPSAPAPAEEAPAAPVQEEAPAPAAEPEVKAPAQPAADTSDDEMSAEETAAIFAENSSGWKRKKAWGKPSAPAPAEEAPAAPVQQEVSAPAPVEEPEVKAPAQPAADISDDEMSAEETAAIFAENSSGWKRKKAWGQHSAPTLAEEAPAAPVQEEVPAPVEEPEVKTPEQPAADTSDDEMSAEETAAIFAENSSGWKRKKAWGQPSAPAPAEEAPAAPVQEEVPAAEPEVKVPEQPAADTSDDEMSAEETAAIFAENSGGWKRKTTRNSSHDEPAASAAQPASEPPAPPAEEKKSAQPAEEPPMKQQMDNEQPAEKIRPEPEEEPQPLVETAAEEEENPLQHRSVFGRAGSASARAASGGWSAFRKMASEEKSGNPFETGAGGHSFAAAARKAQEQHAAHTFGRHSAGESHTASSSWQGWGKHQTTEESAPRTSAGVFGRRSGFGAAASRPREEEGILCPACGAKNPAGAKFCCMCRAELRPAENVCPNCGGKVEPGMKFCPFCGKDI